MRRTHRRPLALVALAFVASACSDSTAPLNETLDLDSALEAMTLSTYVPASVGTTIGFGAGALTPSVTMPPSSCSFAAGSQSFVCPARTFGGLTATRSFTLFTSAGATQAAFDRATTAAIRTVTTTSGTIESAGFQGPRTSRIESVDSLTLSGLLTRRHQLDGMSVMHLTGTDFGTGESTVTMTTRTTGLLLPARGDRNQYPRGGSLSMTMSMPPSMGFDWTFTMTMTFNGTSIVDVTITSGGVTDRCTIDLSKRGPEGSSCFDL